MFEIIKLKPSYGKFRYLVGKIKNGEIVATAICRNYTEIERFKGRVK